MAICTAAEYKAWAGISGATYDARLAILIPLLQSKVELYCNRTFDYNATVTEKVDGAGTDCITLARAPISTVASVTVRYSADNTDTLDADDFAFTTGDDGRLWFYGGEHGRSSLDSGGFPRSPGFGWSPRFPVGRENVTVVYAGGYGGAGQAYPGALVLAFFELVSEGLALSTSAAGGTTAGASTGLLKSITLGKASEVYRDGNEAWKGFEQRFYPWRRPVLGA